MAALGQNEPCHSLRRHGRSTSVSGPAGPAAGASESGQKAVIRRPHLGRFWRCNGPIVSTGRSRDILYLNFCTENPRESGLPELVRGIIHTPLRSPGARFTLARRRS